MNGRYRRQLVRAVAAIASALWLVGCGGGGDAPQAPVSPTPPPPPAEDRSQYALQTEVPPASYSPVAGQPPAQPLVRKANIDRLNEIRGVMGLGKLRQNTALDQAAQKHAEYLILNGGTATHHQDPSKPGFTGVTPEDRARAAGYNGFVGETIGGVNSTDAGGVSEGYYSQCAEGLLGAPYHHLLLVSEALDVGVGIARAPSLDSYACVLMVGTPAGKAGQLPDADVLPAVYPYPGQTNVMTRFYGETPDPIPDLSKPRGHFVIVNLAAYETRRLLPSEILVERFLLRDASGNLIPARLIASPGVRAAAGVGLTPDPHGSSYRSVFLLPLAPLLHGHTYTAEVRVQLPGRTVQRTWSFTTSANPAL